MGEKSSDTSDSLGVDLLLEMSHLSSRRSFSSFSIARSMLEIRTLEFERRKNKTTMRVKQTSSITIYRSMSLEGTKPKSRSLRVVEGEAVSSNK